MFGKDAWYGWACNNDPVMTTLEQVGRENTHESDIGSADRQRWARGRMGASTTHDGVLDIVACSQQLLPLVIPSLGHAAETIDQDREDRPGVLPLACGRGRRPLVSISFAKGIAQTPNLMAQLVNSPVTRTMRLQEPDARAASIMF